MTHSRVRVLRHSVKKGFRAQTALVALSSTIFLLYLFSLVAGDRLSAWEATNFPVLDYIRTCDGKWQRELRNANGTTTELPIPLCEGNMVTYDPFMQENAYCVGPDAYVSGYLSKVRTDAQYVIGQQQFYFGSPFARFNKIPFHWDLNDPDTDFINTPKQEVQNRPTGIQDWGPWRLRGGCDPKRRYDTWYTTVQHDVIHPFWTVKTIAGPFPLPALPPQQ